MKILYKRALSIAIPLAGGVFSQVSAAQDDLSFALEEIIVTAQRREQSLQDVPLAVSAINADTLKQNGVVGLHDLGNIVAGVKIGDSQSSQQSSSIRGINSSPFGFGLEESVPFYLDGIYLGRGSTILGELMNIEQIEVLKGPQGTLFGRNASAGAINVRSARPSEELTASVSANVGNYGLQETKLSANIPVIEDALLVSAGYSKVDRDGWQTNVTTGDTDGYEKDRWGGFIKALWIASDEIEVEITSDWSLQDDHPGYVSIVATTTPLFTDVYATQADPASFRSSSNSRDYASGSEGFTANLPLGVASIAPADAVDPGSRTKVRGTSARVLWDVSDDATFTSASSYRSVVNHSTGDADGSNLGLTSSIVVTSTEEINQEFRFNVSSDQVDWFVGFNAYQQKIDRSFSFSSSGLVPTNILADNVISSIDASFPDGFPGCYVAAGAANCVSTLKGDLESLAATALTEETAGSGTIVSYGAYGDAIWHLNDQWNITVGARYSYDNKEYEQAVTSNDTFAGGGIIYGNLDQLENPADRKLEDSWNNLSGRIGLDYTPSEEVLLYTTLSQGYKSGGFNTNRTLAPVGGSFITPTSASKPFDEETNINLELGMKSTLLDGRLRFNISAFMYEYKDLQFLLAGTSSPVAVTVNASGVDGYGIDNEVLFALTENLTVFSNIAYIQTEYSDDVVDSDGDVRILAGEETAFAPELSGSIGLDHLVDLGEVGSLRTNVTYSYTGAHQQRPNQVTDTHARVANQSSAYHVVSGRISLSSADDKWEVALWGKNLTNEYYTYGRFAAAASVAGVITATPAEPRTYGVNMQYNF